MYGLILAAKSGETFLTMLVSLSAEVTAKLQCQTSEVISNRHPGRSIDYTIISLACKNLS